MEKDRVLDARAEIEKVHDLGQPGTGDLAEVREFRLMMKSWERFHTGGCNPSALNCVVVGERCDSLRSHFENTYTSLV